MSSGQDLGGALLFKEREPALRAWGPLGFPALVGSGMLRLRVYYRICDMKVKGVF